jgi:hypothetical protein
MSFFNKKDLEEVDDIIAYYNLPRKAANNFSKIGDFWADDLGNWWICNKIVAGEPIYTRLTPNEPDKPC